MGRSNKKGSTRKSLPKAQPAEPLTLQERLQRARAESQAAPDPLEKTWFALPVEPDPESDSETPTIELQRKCFSASGIQSEGSADEMRREIERMRQKRRDEPS